MNIGNSSSSILVRWDGWHSGGNYLSYGIGDHSGYNVPGYYVELETGAHSRLTQGDEEEAVQAFQELLTSQPDLLIREGQMYSLSLVNEATPNTILNTRDDFITREFRRARDRVQNRVTQVEQQLATMNAMPTITFNDVKTRKIWCYSENGEMGFILPFKYAPKRIETRDNIYAISDEYQGRLKKDCLLQVRFTNNQARYWALLEPKSLGQVMHYHAMEGADCRGSIQGQDFSATVAGALQFRDHYQNTLEVINYPSVARNSYRSMDINVLLTASRQIEGTAGRWDVTAPPQPTGRQRYRYRLKVQVIRTHDVYPEEWLGCVGRVDSSGEELTRVRFQFALPFGEGLAQKLYTFPNICLRRAPSNRPVTPTPQRVGFRLRRGE